MHTKMYAFLKKFWAIFWSILGKTRIPAKTLKLVWGSGKLPCMRSLGELGSIFLRFSRFSDVPPIKNDKKKIIIPFTHVSKLSASRR